METLNVSTLWSHSGNTVGLGFGQRQREVGMSLFIQDGNEIWTKVEMEEETEYDPL